jgi:sigma-B regulation protein RsbU (phosphoserine phosphatase)
MTAEFVHRSRISGLKRQFLLLIVAVYLVTGAAALGVFMLVMGDITRQLAEDFATQYALRQRDRLLAPIQRELALALKLADSPLLKQWVQDEDHPDLRTAALAELDSYRRHFADRSYFIVPNASKHFYFNDAANAYQGREQGHTLDPELPTDSWYFATFAQETDFNLNVNYDTPLDIYKLWFNIVIREGAQKLGVGGTGLELDRFIKIALSEDRPGVSTLLLDSAGAIKAYHQRAFIDFNTVAKNEQTERSTLYRLLATPAEQAALRERLERLSTGQSSVETLSLTVEDQPYLAAIAYLNDIRWFTVALVDIASVYGSRQFAPLALLLAFSLLALAATMIVLLNRLVLNPLARLHQSAQALAVGNYQQPATVAVDNEIGDLTQAFNQMAHTVRQHTGHLEQLVDERTLALRQANEQLADAHRQLMDSIDYAQLIQQSLLPPPESLARAFGEHFVIWRPRNVVGGDFYYVREDARGRLLLIADCTGHGVPGAFMTMAVSAVLRYITGELGITDPAPLLQALNQRLRDALHQHDGGEGGENGLDAGVCWQPAGERKLIFAGARLDLYYRDLDGAIIRVRGDAHDIGYHRSDPQTIFTSHPIELPPGRACYLTTDGLLDQAGGPKGHGFGRRRFQQVLQDGAEQPLAVQRERLEQALADWQGDHPQRDDITVMGFRPV